MKEAALFVGLVFIGLAVLPVAVYLVGETVFGDYAGGGYTSFYGALQREFRGGEWVVWFLLLSPYLVWQIIRLTAWAYRHCRGASQELRRAP